MSRFLIGLCGAGRFLIGEGGVSDWSVWGKQVSAVSQAGSQVAERFGNRASNQKVAGSVPSCAKMTVCPWARHFTLLALGGKSLYLL